MCCVGEVLYIGYRNEIPLEVELLDVGITCIRLSGQIIWLLVLNRTFGLTLALSFLHLFYQNSFVYSNVKIYLTDIFHMNWSKHQVLFSMYLLSGNFLILNYNSTGRYTICLKQ